MRGQRLSYGREERGRTTHVDEEGLHFLQREPRDLGVAEDDEDEADETDTGIWRRRREGESQRATREVRSRPVAAADHRALEKGQVELTKAKGASSSDTVHDGEEGSRDDNVGRPAGGSEEGSAHAAELKGEELVRVPGDVSESGGVRSDEVDHHH